MKNFAAVVVLILLTMSVSALAQGSKDVIIAQVPFAFIVNGKTLPAGTYQFKTTSNFGQIDVTGIDHKAAAIAMVTTRISPRSETESLVVFDVAGNDHYLAEVYIPGMDGFQVPCAPGKHTHTIVKGRG